MTWIDLTRPRGPATSRPFVTTAYLLVATSHSSRKLCRTSDELTNTCCSGRSPNVLLLAGGRFCGSNLLVGQHQPPAAAQNVIECPPLEQLASAFAKSPFPHSSLYCLVEWLAVIRLKSRLFSRPHIRRRCFLPRETVAATASGRSEKATLVSLECAYARLVMFLLRSSFLCEAAADWSGTTFELKLQTLATCNQHQSSLVVGHPCFLSQ
jgi:hypothetical protein